MFRALLICFLFPVVYATISQNFQSYIEKKFGADVKKQIARTDFGMGGSFGGGSHQAGKKTKPDPFNQLPKRLNNMAYKDEELYGTTYGIAMGLMPMQTALNCDYIKGVRNLIKAVAGFTGGKVDVVGYSLGGPVSRKAILGGKCVETGEDLGEPLTKSVNAYLGVAGAQQGCKMCSWVFSGMCNKNNGIGCDSKFYQDINGKHNYEGQKIYVLQSYNDEIAGHVACGKKASEIEGATKIVTLTGYMHLQMCSPLTARQQHSLLTKGTA
ncbi:Lipase EstA/Esterase EstB family-containing protein [Aphelenchoides bicaudatus]|nr:Lipase EstA/Esterase EstB family-containing protein [Aphelenchoides bicaudatus]